MKPARNNPQGFTLIELVVSVALMSIILVSAYLCLSSAMATRKVVDERAEIMQNGRVAMTLMTADIHGAWPLSKEISLVGMHRSLDTMEADNLDFGTRNYVPQKLRESDFCEVSYFVDKPKGASTYSLWRRRDASPDNDPLSGGVKERIASGVKNLSFEYFDGYKWYQEWGDPDGKAKNQSDIVRKANTSGMPEAIRITLALDGARRKKKGDEDKADRSEPPMIFQTVVRLELAAASTRANAAPSGNPGLTPGDPGQPVPGGFQ